MHAIACPKPGRTLIGSSRGQPHRMQITHLRLASYIKVYYRAIARARGFTIERWLHIIIWQSGTLSIPNRQNVTQPLRPLFQPIAKGWLDRRIKPFRKCDIIRTHRQVSNHSTASFSVDHSIKCTIVSFDLRTFFIVRIRSTTGSAITMTGIPSIENFIAVPVAFPSESSANRIYPNRAMVIGGSASCANTGKPAPQTAHIINRFRIKGPLLAKLVTPPYPKKSHSVCKFQ